MGGNDVRLKGESLERQLAIVHGGYAGQELAYVWKNPTGSKRIRKQGQVMVIQIKSRPDFEGILICMGGRHVAFDAKLTGSTLSDGTPVYRHNKSSIHQCQELLRVQEAGGVAFLLVVWQNPEDNLDERGYAIWPQGHWRDDKGFTVHLEAGTGVSVVPSWDGVMFGYMPDWLAVVVE